MARRQVDGVRISRCGIRCSRSLLSFVLAAVAARVSGETGITPIGALGKITQLSFAVLTPGNVAANLMTANVTGGAAGQCADLMHDLKTGHIIGARPERQIVAQLFGVLTGSLVGTIVYLLLIPDPKAMLLTPEWPAPAVATWKAVAEVLAHGLGAIPPGAVAAMAVAAVLGVVLGPCRAPVPAAHRRTPAERAGARPRLRHSGLDLVLAVPGRARRRAAGALRAGLGVQAHHHARRGAGRGREPGRRRRRLRASARLDEARGK